MKKVLFLLTLLTVGCSTEAPPLADKGYLLPVARINQPELDAKRPVPECQPITPNKIRYRLINEFDQAYTQTSDISISGGFVTALEPMTFPQGTYQVDEISLMNDAVITHTAPNVLSDPDFRDFVTQPLPFTLTIQAEQTTNSSAEVLCYTLEAISLGPNWTGDATVVETQTIYFNVPENGGYQPNELLPGYDPRPFCIDLVTFTADGFRVVEWPIYEPGLQSIPAPKDFSLAYLIAYDGAGVQLERIDIVGGYNQDGVLDENDIILFKENCN